MSVFSGKLSGSWRRHLYPNFPSARDSVAPSRTLPGSRWRSFSCSEGRKNPLSLSAVVEAFTRAGLRQNTGKAYPASRIKETLTDLTKRNIIEMEQGRGWRIPL